MRFWPLVALVGAIAVAQSGGPAVGEFEGMQDVGPVLHQGAATYDPSTKTYTVTGSGDNVWAKSDEFRFVWKKVSGGDLSITSDVQILGTGGDAHRKAMLMIRQSLDPDSAYVDAALHGDGLTSLQFREAKGDATHEVQANVTGPKRLRLTKRGNVFYLSTADSAGGDLRLTGSTTTIAIQEPFYVGVGVTAHNKDRMEKAAFSNVDVRTLPAPTSDAKPVLHSTLEVITVSSTDRRAIYSVADHFEAPNWTPRWPKFPVQQQGAAVPDASRGRHPCGN